MRAKRLQQVVHFGGDASPSLRDALDFMAAMPSMQAALGTNALRLALEAEVVQRLLRMLRASIECATQLIQGHQLLQCAGQAGLLSEPIGLDLRSFSRRGGRLLRGLGLATQRLELVASHPPPLMHCSPTTSAEDFLALRAQEISWLLTLPAALPSGARSRR